MSDYRVVQQVQVLALRGDKLEVGGYAYINGIDNTGSVKRLLFNRRSGGKPMSVDLPTKAQPDLDRSSPKGSPNCYSQGGFQTTEVPLGEVLPDGDYQLSFEVQAQDVTASAPLEVPDVKWWPYAKPSTTPTHSVIPCFRRKSIGVRIRKSGPLARAATRLSRGILELGYEAAILVIRRRWRLFFLYPLHRLVRRHLRAKHIWLMGERFDTAQDNGYWVYKYIRDNDLVPNCYYAIDKRSPDYQRVASLGNVIQHGSLRHSLYLLSCDKLINAYAGMRSMYTPDYLSVLQCHPEWDQSRKYFLRHGVMGLVRIRHTQDKNSLGLSLVVVSSQAEKDAFVQEYGYDDQDVAITGLARWDQLVSTGVGNTILFMPTWRVWVQSPEQLENSEYFKHCVSLLQNPELHRILEKYEYQLIFFPHYLTQRHMRQLPEFHPHIQVVRQGEETVQSLLIRSDLLITDYSSVSFEFSYMNKPVIFYQFDSDQYFTRHYQPGLVTQDKLFGELAKDESQVVAGVVKFAEKDEQFMQMAENNPYVFKAPGQHTRLNYEAVLSR